MESVQAHFKNLKYHKMWADHLRAPAYAILRLLAQNVCAAVVVDAPHLVRFLLARAKCTRVTVLVHKKCS